MKFINSKNAPTVIWTIAAAIILVYVFIDGMKLPGIPKPGNLEKITVSYPAITEVEKEFTDEESLATACEIMESLKYSPFKTTNKKVDDAITITYYYTNGRSRSVIANNERVLWDNKVRSLKDVGVFVDLAEEAFFAEELAAN